jgi:methylamine dehydrogenase light chain
MQPENLSPSDRLAEQLSRRLAVGSTRRSLLGRASALLLGAIGVKLVPVVPVIDRAALAKTAAAAMCSDWQYCGISGSPCTLCNNGNDTTCPTGTSQGSGSWQQCCTNPQGKSIEITYWDCCINGADVCPNSTVCKGANKCPTIAVWCNQGWTYSCSQAVQGADC